MTEKIIRTLSELTGLETKLKLNGKNGVSLYPEKVTTGKILRRR